MTFKKVVIWDSSPRECKHTYSQQIWAKGRAVVRALISINRPTNPQDMLLWNYKWGNIFLADSFEDLRLLFRLLFVQEEAAINFLVIIKTVEKLNLAPDQVGNWKETRTGQWPQSMSFHYIQRKGERERKRGGKISSRRQHSQATAHDWLELEVVGCLS